MALALNELKSKATIIPLAGDASTRRYFRLSFHNKSPYKTAILMLFPETLSEGEELPFLNVHRTLTQMGINVPEIYFDMSHDQCLILEDCGDLLLQKAIQNKGEAKILSLYQLALEELFKMQFWQNQNGDCVAYQLAFDTEKLLWELDFFLEQTLRGHLNLKFSPKEEKCLHNFFLNLSSYLANQPRFFTHRDFHSRNLLVQENNIRVLDFQDARMGPCQYDLVSLIYDAYVTLPQKVEKKLINTFIQEHKKRKSFSKESFEKTLDWMKLQRSLKAAGTFGYMAQARKKKLYLPYLPRVFQLSVAVLKKYPEFKEVNLILEPSLQT